jgi:MFS family permease
MWGRWADRVGAKPAVGVSILGIGGCLLLWTLVWPSVAWNWSGIPAIALLMGIFTGGLTVAMSKFELGFIPLEGRAHFVAMNVTISGLAAAGSTLAAGSLLNVLTPLHLLVGSWRLDRYDCFFALCAVMLLVPLYVRRSLPEERSRSIRALTELELRRRSRRLRQLLRGLRRR